MVSLPGNIVDFLEDSWSKALPVDSGFSNLDLSVGDLAQLAGDLVRSSELDELDLRSHGNELSGVVGIGVHEINVSWRKS